MNVFVRRGANPNLFTTAGLFLNAASGAVFATGHLRMGGVLFLLGGVLDTLDGRVARGTGRVTRFGALYDSTLDRYSEIFVFFGMMYYFLHSPHRWALAAILLALGGSLMVSYVRARAEGLGFECKIGIMQRAERVLVLGIGALVHEAALLIALVLVAVLANVTAIQRLHYIWALENGSKNAGLPHGQNYNGD
ncbi:MAG: CDP-alcohol phosphatidyltransferase family protein [candidate division KSB1 bacterium]|nr:CDP-alcohol phosphatidyltransferase family protein [candidate division KSB1 bacterium]